MVIECRCAAEVLERAALAAQKYASFVAADWRVRADSLPNCCCTLPAVVAVLPFLAGTCMEPMLVSFRLVFVFCPASSLLLL